MTENLAIFCNITYTTVSKRRGHSESIFYPLIQLPPGNRCDANSPTTLIPLITINKQRLRGYNIPEVLYNQEPQFLLVQYTLVT